MKNKVRGAIVKTINDNLQLTRKLIKIPDKTVNDF